MKLLILITTLMKNFLIACALASFLLTACNNDDAALVSENPPPVDATPTPARELKLVTSSNTSGKVTFSDLLAASPIVKSVSVSGLDSDGIFFDSGKDQIVLASRTNNRLESYLGLRNSIISGTDNLMLAFSSTSDFNNAREIAVIDDKVIVTQDQNTANGNINKILVYQKTASSFNLMNTYTVDFKVWGIHIEGSDLYAVADLTSDIVVFNNFFSNPSGNITPSKRVVIEGLVRTHGITFSAADNRMILTDVGSATSATDGGLVIINNFSSVFMATANMGTITTGNQIRVYGPTSLLGNPVDVAYDNVSKNIYVAERLNGGGQVLTFSLPTSNGDYAPTSSRIEAGVTAVYLVRK